MTEHVRFPQPPGFHGWVRGGRAAGMVLVVMALGAVGAGLGIPLALLTKRVGMLQGQLAASEGQVAQLQTQKDELTQRVNVLQNERKTIDSRLASLQAQATSAAAELERSRTMVEEWKAKVQQAEEAGSQLQDQVARMTSERDETRTQVQRLQRQHTQLQREATRWRQRFNLLNRDYRQLTEQLTRLGQAQQPAPLSPAAERTPTTASEAGQTLPPTASEERPPSVIPGAIELPPIVVTREPMNLPAPIWGRVVEVNEEHGFVLFDKGSGDGVNVGMSFEVQRGGLAIGQLTVIRVRPQLSACDIAQSSRPLRVGDLVVQRG